MNELKQVESLSNITLKEIETGIKMTKGTLKTMAAILEAITRSRPNLSIDDGNGNELFQYMRNGKEPCIVEIPFDEVEKMEEKLDDKGISFLVYQLDDKGIFLTKTEDTMLIQQLALQTQLESHHLTEIPLEIMIDAYAGEQLEGIYNLDYYMVSQFKQNIETMSSQNQKYLTYAVQLDSEKGKGLYSILFHPDFFQEAKYAYIRASIELGGPASDIYKKQIDKEKDIPDQDSIDTQEAVSNKKVRQSRSSKDKKEEKNFLDEDLIQKSNRLIELYERKLSLDNGNQNEVWSSFDEFFELEMVNDQHDLEEQELARKYAQSIYTTFHQGMESIFEIPKKDENIHVQELYEYQEEVL